MSQIEFHTSVEDVIESEDIPGFSIKKVNLGKNDFWTPLRTVYLSTDLQSTYRKSILQTKEKSAMFEANRVIYMDKSYDAINTAIQESDDEKIKRCLKVNEDLSRENISIPLSFSTLPYLKMGENYEELLDYLHAFSSILFVPNVMYGKAKTKMEYNANEFCSYVDNVLKIFKERNAKPIFVPFNIDYKKQTRDKIIAHYRKKGYTNIWIDFQGKGFTKNIIAKMRTLQRLINKEFGKNAHNVVIYLANIRKTPREAPDDYRITPSDFIGAFSYGDVIGAPWKGKGFVLYQKPNENEAYWEKKGYNTKREYDRAKFMRDCSIFEDLSYYYLYPNKIHFKNRHLDRIRKDILSLGVSKKSSAVKMSYSLSGVLTQNELKQLKKTVENEGKLLDYIGDKEFFREKGDTLLKELKTPGKSKKKTVEKGLFDFV